MINKQVLFNILRSSLWGDTLVIPQEFQEWRALFDLAKSQAVLGLVANTVVADTKVSQRIPVVMQKFLRGFVMSNIATHTLMNRVLVRVVSTLDDADIEYVLLKGQGLALNYPLPQLRQCGDIDIYVQNKDCENSCKLIETMATNMLPVEIRETDKHYDVIVGDITIEIHQFSDINASTYYDKIYQKYSNEGLSSNLRILNIAGRTIKTPSDTFNAFYIFNHLWHHFLTSGIGLRQFIDWMLFLHKYHLKIDEGKLQLILENMDLMGPWQVFGCILVDELGLPREEFPFYSNRYIAKKKYVLRMVLKEGNFGKERAYYKERKGENYWKSKIKSLCYQFIRYFQLLLIFPSHALRQFTNMILIGFKAVGKDKFSKDEYRQTTFR